MSKCPKCDEDDLVWHKTSKNRNWLKTAKGKWHNCPMMQAKSGGRRRWKHCPLCPKTWGYYQREKDLAGHQHIYHPNNETYDEVDIKLGKHLIVESRFWITPPSEAWKIEQEHI